MFKNLAIKWKLITLVGGLLFMMTIMGLAGLIGTQKIGKSMHEIGEVNLPSVDGLLRLNEAQTAIKAATLSALIYENNYSAQDKFAEVLNERKHAWTNAEAAWKIYEPLPQTADEAKLWKQFVEEWAAWKKLDLDLASTIEALSKNSGEDEQRTLFAEFFRQYEASLPLFSRSEDTLEKVARLNGEGAKESVKTGNETLNSSQQAIAGIALAAFLLSITLAVYITRSITQPLSEAVSVAQRVAIGDLTSRIDVQSRDETGQLMLSLKTMNDSLVKIVSQVRNSTDTVATASGQIASGNLDLSSRTEEQASSLEETASSMEELTSTVKQNADNAKQANQLAASASEIAVKGGDVVSEVVHTMQAINESPKKIVDIISVIDGIAFQTNILALNAAVEAARAGEQGRGFAVVASEVRSLAQRSASAAKEIKELIGNSVEKVDAGSALVGEAGSTISQVVESVKRVTDIMSEITAASQEQAAGIEQVNQAVAQMDEVTQQNAALVEEAAAASQSMQDEAANLANIVSVFRLSGMPAQAPRGAGKSHSPAGRAQVTLAAKPAATAKAAMPSIRPKTLPASVNNEQWEAF